MCWEIKAQPLTGCLAGFIALSYASSSMQVVSTKSGCVYTHGMISTPLCTIIRECINFLNCEVFLYQRPTYIFMLPLCFSSFPLSLLVEFTYCKHFRWYYNNLIQNVRWTSKSQAWLMYIPVGFSLASLLSNGKIFQTQRHLWLMTVLNGCV